MPEGSDDNAKPGWKSTRRGRHCEKKKDTLLGSGVPPNIYIYIYVLHNVNIYIYIYEYIYINKYIYIYINTSAQIIIFRRSSLISNNFTAEILTSSEVINYFTPLKTDFSSRSCPWKS